MCVCLLSFEDDHPRGFPLRSSPPLLCTNLEFRKSWRWVGKHPTSTLATLMTDLGRFLISRNRGLTSVGNILCAACLEDFLCTIALCAVFGVNREQDVSIFDLALIAFRLVLWNTHADECSRKSSGRRAASRACQGRHDRTG